MPRRNWEAGSSSVKTDRLTEERAEALRVLLDLAPYLPITAEEAAEIVSLGDVDLIEALTEEDRHLANACLELEARIRHDEFAAVERLGALVSGGVGDLDSRVASLPKPELYEAIRAIIDCFWIDY